jgi:hypothetical protein
VIKVSTWATVTSVTAVIIFTTVDTSAVLANCDDRANSDVCSSTDSIGKSYCSYYVYNNGKSDKRDDNGMRGTTVVMMTIVAKMTRAAKIIIVAA